MENFNNETSYWNGVDNQGNNHFLQCRSTAMINSHVVQRVTFGNWRIHFS